MEDDDYDEENDSDIDSNDSEEYIEEPDPVHEARMAELGEEKAELLRKLQEEEELLRQETALRDQILAEVEAKVMKRQRLEELLRQETALRDQILAENRRLLALKFNKNA